VVTDDVVEEPQAATHSATTATIGTNAGEYLNDISRPMRPSSAVRLPAYSAPLICRGLRAQISRHPRDQFVVMERFSTYGGVLV
jgi:hypothetical protein